MIKTNRPSKHTIPCIPGNSKKKKPKGQILSRVCGNRLYASAVRFGRPPDSNQGSSGRCRVSGHHDPQQLPQQNGLETRAYKADCDNNINFETLRSGMSCSTLPTAIFWHHMQYGKAMLHLKRGNASGKQLRPFSLCRGRLVFTDHIISFLVISDPGVSR